MKKDKYVVVDPMGGTDFFDTEQEALDYIADMDFSDEIPEEYVDGQLIVAKITHVSKYVVTDEKKNYPCILVPNSVAHCSECSEADRNGKECEGAEEWPYNSDFDTVGKIEMEEVVE